VRPVKPQPAWNAELEMWVWPNALHGYASCYPTDGLIDWLTEHSPYPVGSRLWVRETWTRARTWTGKPWIYKAELTAEEWARREEIAKRNPPDPSGYVLRWNSPIFMPRRASRITLEVTGVRAERLQDIAYPDIVAEGYPDPNHPYPARMWYMALWDSINGKRYPWDSNPWVWVVEFRRIQ